MAEGGGETNPGKVASSRTKRPAVEIRLPALYQGLLHKFTAICAAGSMIARNGACCPVDTALKAASDMLNGPSTTVTLTDIRHFCALIPDIITLEPQAESVAYEAGWSVRSEELAENARRRGCGLQIRFLKAKHTVSRARVRAWSKHLRRTLEIRVRERHKKYIDESGIKFRVTARGALHPSFHVDSVSWDPLPLSELPEADVGARARESDSDGEEKRSERVYQLQKTPLLPDTEVPGSSPGARLSARALLQYLRSLPFYRDQIAKVVSVPARRPRFGSVKLTPTMKRVLHAYGHPRLYAHQARAIAALQSGRHAAIATSTSSGKSLIFNMVAIDRVLSEPGASAVFIFPTKALAQDQLGALRRLIERAGVGARVRCETLDGDTPPHVRSACQTATSFPQIVLTNPDMLHASILPRHAAYSGLLSRLRVVVLDEAHTYRGSFGSHVSLVLRRLRRVVAIHRDAQAPTKDDFNRTGSHKSTGVQQASSPLFVCCSATISNPLAHMSALTGIPPDTCSVVDGAMDGSPTGEKTFVFWNPPLKFHNPTAVHVDDDVDATGDAKKRQEGCGCCAAEAATAPTAGQKRKQRPPRDPTRTLSYRERTARDKRMRFERRRAEAQNARRSPQMETAFLMAQLVRFGFKTITFCKVRRVCELVLKYSHRLLARSARAQDAMWASRVRSYRAGYRLESRRTIERALFGGKLSGVVATSALELGVDVGSLDASLHLGFPGSTSSFFQQAGRCGRKSANSVTIMVGYGSPLDQYVLRNPGDTLFSSSFPAAVVDPGNPDILKKHLLCAAFEQPLAACDRALFGGRAFDEALGAMEIQGWLRQHSNEGVWTCGRATAWEAGLMLDHSSTHEKTSFMAAHEAPLPGSDPLSCPAPPAVATTACSAEGRAVHPITGEALDTKGEAAASADPRGALGRLRALVARDQDRTPARDVSIRNINHKGYSVVCKRTGVTIDTVDEGRAFFEVHPGATYMQQGANYVVTDLDIHKLVAYVERVGELDYYTSMQDHKSVTVVRVLPDPAAAGSGDTTVSCKHGHVTVSTSVYGYHKIKKRSNAVMETVPLHLPLIQLHTKAFWVDIPPWVQIRIEKQGLDFRGGMHGAVHAVAAVTPLRLLCDGPSDLATECPNVKESAQRPNRILVYERHKGGLGVSLRGRRCMGDLLRMAARMVRSCRCKSPVFGCPSCVQSAVCPEYNIVIDKTAALVLLDAMVELLCGDEGTTKGAEA